MNVQAIIIERGVPMPPPRQPADPNRCTFCSKRDRVPPYKTCNECRERVKEVAASRKAQGLCVSSPCPNAPKDGHTMCADHLQAMVDYSAKRRDERKKANVCSECGDRPGFWGVRCVICRQLKTKDPLPAGLRVALAKYRRREKINARREQAKSVVVCLQAYRPELIDSRAIQLLVMRHGLEDRVDRTLEEIGAKFSITRERVRQIEVAVLKRVEKKGLDVYLLRQPFAETERPAPKSRSYLVSDEQRKHSAAHNLVKTALASGALTQQPCEFVVAGARCGDYKTVGHHPDYDKPLEVEWLCREHHMEAHRGFWLDKITNGVPALMAKLQKHRPRHQDITATAGVTLNTIKKVLTDDPSVRDDKAMEVVRYIMEL